MARKHQEWQSVIRQYRLETGQKEVDIHDVVKYAVEKLRWSPPSPTDPMEMLARECARSLREETRTDSKTGRPYRVNHAYRVGSGDGQLTLWIDIEDATRKQMHLSLMQRREQMVGDAVQLSFDMDHWNGIHPGEEPISVPLDFEPDVEWRKNSESEGKAS